MPSNLQVIQGWTQEGWNDHDPHAIEKYYAEDFVGHDPYQPVIVGRDYVHGFHSHILNVFPDFELRIDDSVEEGDLVCCRYTARGTQQSEFMGLAATGRPVTFSVMATWRIRDGRITDVWQHWDALGALQQIRGELTEGLVMDPANASKTIATDDEGRECNCENVRTWMHGAWNEGRLDLVEQCLEQDCWFWDPSGPPTHGLEAFYGWVQAMDTAFPLPERSLHIDFLLSEGNKTAFRVTLLGRHLGEFMGIPPTGRLVNFSGTIMAEHENGRFKRAWQIMDAMAMLQQLGANP